MRDNITIGLVTPQSTNKVPAEGGQMYPGDNPQGFIDVVQKFLRT